MGRTISNEVRIEASPGAVWDILVAFDSYPEWNPFIKSIKGAPEKGSKLEVRIEPPGGRGMTFRPTVLSAIPGVELRWLGMLGVRGVFDGEHRFLLARLDDGGVGFTQQEQFSGLLVPLTKKTLARTARGFEQMNGALKHRAEASSTSSSR